MSQNIPPEVYKLLKEIDFNIRHVTYDIAKRAFMLSEDQSDILMSYLTPDIREILMTFTYNTSDKEMFNNNNEH